MEVTKMIIDADTGVDDALAILYALKSPRIELQGVTTVFGNTSVGQATENTLRLLELAGAQHVPVAAGAERALVREPGPFSEKVHGHNGVGDAELPPTSRSALDTFAPEWLVQQANEHEGELVIVAMGRLTNLALALDIDPDLPKKLKKVVVMGGNIRVPGNITPVAEANIWGDPEAADRVLTAGLPLTLVGLDVTLKTRVNDSHLHYLKRYGREENREIINFIDESLQHYFGFYREVNYFQNSAPLHDPLAVIAAVHPELLTYQTMNVRVECEGTHTTGMVVADLRAIPMYDSPIQVCVDVDAETAEGNFLSVFL
ncbi:nucleoside hydrolase [Paenibacillus sp. JX-17]|uniref:Nucleoside hydrolase n=1 Tax=Paenibacillus lacisoli TaxID=3064525 RepID=A0ABT9CFG3_9BACL|nr:nucleoside hydrolase [Paenibacillus sp. JX-17]MDO7906343.1 nucleoside hydrolase [Paenibacillus sp. JX-17]